MALLFGENSISMGKNYLYLISPLIPLFAFKMNRSELSVFSAFISVCSILSIAKISSGDIPGEVMQTQLFVFSVLCCLYLVFSQKYENEELLKGISRVEKLSSIGEMSAEIIHELKNPLTIVQGSLLVLKKNNLDDEKKEKLIQSVEKASLRISRIVKGVSRMSSNSTEDQTKTVDVKEFVNSTLDFMSFKIKNTNVKISNMLPSGIQSSFQTTQIEQVLVNLVSNSIDAIADQPAPWIRIFQEFRSDCFHIIIQDSGRGIPEEVVPQLFSGSYTSKSADKGSGLGLGIARKLAIANGGGLEYKKFEGHTAFILKLPIQGSGKPEKVA